MLIFLFCCHGGGGEEEDGLEMEDASLRSVQSKMSLEEMSQ